MSQDDTKENTQTIQYVWGLIAKGSAIDRERNNISLFDVIDQITLPDEVFSKDGKQKIGFDHEIIMTWRRVVDQSLIDDDISFACRLSLIGPSGSTLQETTNKFILQKDSRRTRQRVRVDGFLITDPGDYVYRVAAKGRDTDDFNTVNEIPFEVRTQN